MNVYNDLTTKEERLSYIIPAHQSAGEIVDEETLREEKVETCGYDEVIDIQNENLER